MATLANDTKVERKYTISEKYGKKRNKKQDKIHQVQAVDLSDNDVYAVLEDSTIPFEDRQQKLIDMLTVNLESKEGVEESQKNVQMVKDIVKELLNRFTAHNRKSIEFTRDNPMHALKESMQEVFDNYHAITVGRSDLKNKLVTVDNLIEELGGEDKLVVALVEAKTRTKETDELKSQLDDANETFTRAATRVHSITSSIRATDAKIAELEEAFMSWMRPGVQTELRENKQSLGQLQEELAVAVGKRDEAAEKKVQIAQELDALTNSDDYKIHMQITRILDIASPEFKEQLTTLAEATLTYIDDTQNVMTQVRNQLEHLMKDVDGGLDVNVNIREQVAILSGALQESNKVSSKKLADFKAKNKGDDVSSLAKLESDKIARAGDIFVSETSSTAASVTMISSEVQKIEVVLLSLRDQLADGLSDADEQLLMAVNTASASGMVMLNRAQTLGTLAQAIISRGQYMNEAEETFGQLAHEFERSLAVKAGRNDTIASLSNVIADISAAMDDRNDAATNIAIERRELISDLSEEIDRLRQVAEDTRELESRVNEELAKEVA